MLDWPPRYVLALVEGLSPGSRTQASIHGQDFLGFGRTEGVLADLYDVTVRIAAGKKWKSSMLYPRPKAKRKPGRSLASMVPRVPPVQPR